ncbi:hypothetical protein CDAR_95031 [Caerostris darwini]|uniref:Uncharacterized protein n=1 Tax=Caerostris darwini TaxID=1538125 RepID=A0AAV4PP77_9ARAC|nr:hypothetical protein CDAR_95031 [Caerostris darwini]
MFTSKTHARPLEKKRKSGGGRMLFCFTLRPIASFRVGKAAEDATQALLGLLCLQVLTILTFFALCCHKNGLPTDGSYLSMRIKRRNLEKNQIRLCGGKTVHKFLK